MGIEENDERSSFIVQRSSFLSESRPFELFFQITER